MGSYDPFPFPGALSLAGLMATEWYDTWANCAIRTQ